MATKTATIYTTYAEAEKARQRKQKQFPNFYVKIRGIKHNKKQAFIIEVK